MRDKTRDASRLVGLSCGLGKLLIQVVLLNPSHLLTGRNVWLGESMFVMQVSISRRRVRRVFLISTKSQTRLCVTYFRKIRWIELPGFCSAPRTSSSVDTIYIYSQDQTDKRMTLASRLAPGAT